MVEFTRPPEGPGEIIDRRGQEHVPMSQGALHPFSPRVWWQNEQTRMESAQRNRRALGFEDGTLPAVQPEPRPANRMQQVPLDRGGLDGILTGIFDRLSRQVAGGSRMDPRDLLPGAQDPLEGIVPDEFVPEVQGVDWFDPTVWARATPEDISMVDLSKIQPATGAGREGKGLDWFRGGEAKNNYANRHNPLYQARREFAVAITPQIEEMFGVSAQGSAGYMRQPSSGDAAPGGRSGNSDHYSGGALDLFGTKEEMVALRNWAVEQPWVSFVRCQSESHYDHVHLSIDVGWIAQNYFQGREVPSVVNTPSRSQNAVSASTSARGSSDGSVQVADDPNLNRAL